MFGGRICVVEVGGRPNTTSGVIVVPRASDRVLKMFDQKSESFRRDQNICRRSAGDCLHLLQASLLLGNILANLACAL